MPGIFAACTNEDFLTENENQFAGKETVKMVLSANYGAEGQADTKMVNQNGTFLWDNTDELGATLLLNPTTENKIYSNNKFGNTLTDPQQTGVDFTTDATTVVGEYLFYYPYSSKMTTKLDGVQYSLKEPQVYDPTGEEMMKNNFMIAPRVKVDGSEPGTLTLPITMRSIYGYGLLNLAIAQDNPNYTELYVQKVIIRYTSNVYKDGYINMNNVPNVDLTASTLEGKAEEDAYEGMSTAEIRNALLEAADLKLTARSVDENGDEEGYEEGTILSLTAAKDGSTTIGQVSISCLSDENPNGIKVTKDGGFSTRVLLPTTDNNGETVTVTVFTNKGEWTFTSDADARIKPGHTINLANINREENGDDMFELEGEATDVTTINAISEADFIQSMKAVSDDDVTVTVGNFELTAAAVNAIPSGVTVNFDNEDAITFNGNMTLDDMTFDGPVKFKGGDITVTDDVTFAGSKAITIDGANVVMTNGGADASTTDVKSGTLTIAINGQYTSTVSVNGGTLNIGKAETKATTSVTTFLTEVNEGTVNVNVPFTLKANVTVGSVAGAAATLNVNANVTSNSAETITVNKGGKVVNKAELTVTTNNGTIDAEAGNLTVTTNAAGDAKFTPVINYNGGEASVGTNNGIIYNNVKAVDGTLKITTDNAGVIYVVAASQTDATAANTGNIYFTPGAYVNLPNGFSGSQDEKGNLIYTVSEDMTATKLEQEFGKCTAILIKDGATLNLDKALTLANLQMVTLDGGKVNLPATIGSGTSEKAFVQQVKSFAVYVNGESEITGTGTLQWANDNTNNKIVVKSKAYFKNSAKLVNFKNMTVEDGDTKTKTIVENPGTISGATAPTLTNNRRWIGNAFETKAYADPNA